MKTPLFLVTGFILIVLQSTHAAPPPREVRTVTDLNVISARALQRSISPRFYKSLLVSPVQGWVTVGANLSGTHLSGLRIVHSEMGGRFDSLALQLAKEIQIAGYYSLERPQFGGAVLFHLLVYQIADGTMVLSFPQFTEPGGDQVEYFGCARLAVLKEDGSWNESVVPRVCKVRAGPFARALRTRWPWPIRRSLSADTGKSHNRQIVIILT